MKFFSFFSSNKSDKVGFNVMWRKDAQPISLDLFQALQIHPEWKPDKVQWNINFFEQEEDASHFECNKYAQGYHTKIVRTLDGCVCQERGSNGYPE